MFLRLVLFLVCAATGGMAAVAAEPDLAASTATAGLTPSGDLSGLSIQALEQRVAASDSAAQAELGARYGRGAGVEQDYAKAIELLRAAAAKNDANAQFFLGTAYSNGLGVEHNEAQAVIWYDMAARQGHGEAAYWLAQRIANGVGGIVASWRAAIPFFWQAAEQGVAPAEFQLGYAYQMGLGVDPSPRAAAYWYRRTNSRGKNLRAQYNLRVLIEGGQEQWEPGDPGEPPAPTLQTSEQAKTDEAP